MPMGLLSVTFLFFTSKYTYSSIPISYQPGERHCSSTISQVWIAEQIIALLKSQDLYLLIPTKVTIVLQAARYHRTRRSYCRFSYFWGDPRSTKAILICRQHSIAGTATAVVQPIMTAA